MLQTRIPVFAAMLAVFGLVGLLQPAQSFAIDDTYGNDVYKYGFLRIEKDPNTNMYKTNIPGTERYSFSVSEGDYIAQVVFTAREESALDQALSFIPGGAEFIENLRGTLGSVIELPEYVEFELRVSPTMEPSLTTRIPIGLRLDPTRGPIGMSLEVGVSINRLTGEIDPDSLGIGAEMAENEVWENVFGFLPIRASDLALSVDAIKRQPTAVTGDLSSPALGNFYIDASFSGLGELEGNYIEVDWDVEDAAEKLEDAKRQIGDEIRKFTDSAFFDMLPPDLRNTVGDIPDTLMRSGYTITKLSVKTGFLDIAQGKIPEAKATINIKLPGLFNETFNLNLGSAVMEVDKMAGQIAKTLGKEIVKELEALARDQTVGAVGKAFEQGFNETAGLATDFGNGAGNFFNSFGGELGDVIGDMGDVASDVSCAFSKCSSNSKEWEDDEKAWKKRIHWVAEGAAIEYTGVIIELSNSLSPVLALSATPEQRMSTIDGDWQALTNDISLNIDALMETDKNTFNSFMPNTSNKCTRRQWRCDSFTDIQNDIYGKLKSQLQTTLDFKYDQIVAGKPQEKLVYQAWFDFDNVWSGRMIDHYWLPSGTDIELDKTGTTIGMPKNIPAGWAALGGTYANNGDVEQSVIVKKAAGITAPPVGYEFLIKMKGGNNNADYAWAWRPIAPEGYVAMGIVYHNSSTVAPSLDAVVTLNKSYADIGFTSDMRNQHSKTHGYFGPVHGRDNGITTLAVGWRTGFGPVLDMSYTIRELTATNDVNYEFIEEEESVWDVLPVTSDSYDSEVSVPMPASSAKNAKNSLKSMKKAMKKARKQGGS